MDDGRSVGRQLELGPKETIHHLARSLPAHELRTPTSLLI